MIEFIKKSNGHTLHACINKEEIKKDLMQYLEDVKETPETYLMEVFKDYDEATGTIRKAEEDVLQALSLVDNLTEEDIWNAQVFKKNGTFKKTTKPVIWTAKYGSYWDDSYGWYCPHLRWETMDSDTVVTLVVATYVEHN